MAKRTTTPSGRESPFEENELIVSKTDLKGRLTYVNDVFLRVSRYTLKETIGQPHSMIRHPEMPRCIFKLLWDSIQSKKEIFAYVVNMAQNGDHYWVLAHVTPSFDANQNVIGYHSNRRKPDKEQVRKVKDLYASLLAEENRHENRKDGMARGSAVLADMLKQRSVAYDEFVFSL